MQKPYQTNLLIAGFDEGAGPSLYWMDYLATMHSMNIAGTGYGRFSSELFSMSSAPHLACVCPRQCTSCDVYLVEPRSLGFSNLAQHEHSSPTLQVDASSFEICCIELLLQNILDMHELQEMFLACLWGEKGFSYAVAHCMRRTFPAIGAHPGCFAIYLCSHLQAVSLDRVMRRKSHRR